MAWSLSRAVPALALLIWGGVATAAPTYWQDDAGTVWQVPATLPSRWVVLGPHLVDMVTRLGADALMVGVMDDYPLPGRHARSLSGHAVVGRGGQVNLEAVRRLRPDLVVYWQGGLSAGQQARLRSAGLPLLAIEPDTLREIPERLRWLGALAGRAMLADRLAREQLRRLDGLALRPVAHRLKGFYQVWTHPLYTLSPRHLVSQALRRCGVDVIVPDTAIPAPVVSLEFVVRSAPDVILLPPEQLAAARALWQRFPAMPAVRRQAIIAVDDRALTRPGLTLLDALPTLCDQVTAWQTP